MSSTHATSRRFSTSSAADRARARRAAQAVRALKRDTPDARCALVHSNPLELLVATILSAQCTDARVNLVTRDLFRKYRTAEDYARADLRSFAQEIRSTGFYRNKAKWIVEAAKILIARHGGRVPDTMEDLLELPGVARKTANVVLGTWFRKAAGVVVDTHVHRIARRLQLTRRDDPSRIERDLMELLPPHEWIDFSHRLIWHGRRICMARNPKCGECGLSSFCPSAGRFD